MLRGRGPRSRERRGLQAIPEFSRVVPVSQIIGLGTVKQDGQERMLILVDIEQLMTGADMAPVDAPLQ